MFNIQLTDVVKNLLILNGLMFLAAITMGTQFYNWMGLYYPSSDYFQPYQLVTHMFMHADVGHIFFNMLMLVFLGPRVEMALGPQRFLVYYLTAGFGAVILHLIVRYFEFQYMLPPEYFNMVMESPNSYMVGASGAVFGILMAFGYLFPNETLQLIFPPVALKAKYFVLILGAMELFAGVNPTPGSNVAHFAHLGGMIFGFLLLFYWFGRPRT